ncbi:phage tail terminator family protein [Fusobacterium mortiferum]|uniref:Phage protein n=1 Tax=Fusobacterium mortiferum TaxID=850 RepID=A0ABS2G4C3_FUSMR|nr:hypothetical protein [Fusobacterium mortiferum]MBM6875457.1 hypothetical protein [Fusobacterium mortiferum]
MLKKLIIAINTVLEKINSEAEIYIEEIPQGFKKPCFCVQVLNPDEKQLLGDRYLRTYNFCIQHFPKKGLWENAEIAELLHRALNMIDLGNENYVRGINRRYEIVEKNLYYFVTYRLHVRDVDTDDNYMEEMLCKGGIK